MSSPKHQSSHSSKPTANSTNQKCSFEETQISNIQKMIESLAKQILSTLQETENTDPKAQLSLLRVYAQYMNLYMKFETKYFPPNPDEPNRTENPPTNRKNGSLNKPAKKNGAYPKLSTNGTMDFVRQSNQEHQRKCMRQTNPKSALSIPPSSG